VLLVSIYRHYFNEEVTAMITTFDIHTFVVYSAILHHTFVLTASAKKTVLQRMKIETDFCHVEKNPFLSGNPLGAVVVG